MTRPLMFSSLAFIVTLAVVVFLPQSFLTVAAIFIVAAAVLLFIVSIKNK